MWATILKIADKTSIVFPKNIQNWTWCLITSDLGELKKQPLAKLWYTMYSIYIQIIYRTHYKPLNRPEDYQNEFLKTFIHLLKVAHIKMKNAITNNIATIDRPLEDIVMKEKQIIKEFCSIWTHPYISSLSSSNELNIHIKHRETQDYNYRLQTQKITHLTMLHHPYHTTNH